MSELHHDPMHRQWVIYAGERGRRPSDFTAPAAAGFSGPCAFCEGNEQLTPPEVYAVRPGASGPNQPGWRVRVVPNKYAALADTPQDVERRPIGDYERLAGFGAHEVIIETPRHGLGMADLDDEQLQQVFLVYRLRLRALLADDRIRYVQLFKNHGQAAGASLAHTHTQLLALPVVPRTVWIELRSGYDHYQRTQRCLFLDLVQQELQSGARVVAENADFVAYVPYAARFPFEMWVTPKTHQHDFLDSDDLQLASLATLVGDVLRRLRACLNDPPYNLVLFTAPRARERSENSPYWRSLPHIFHWHLEIIPRLTVMAGFEFGSGLTINPVAPEEAASLLRNRNAP